MLSKLLLSFVTPTMLKSLARKAFIALGTWLIAKGYVPAGDWNNLLGALAIVGAVLHALYDHRDSIAVDLENAMKKFQGTSVIALLALPALLLTGCRTSQVVDNSDVNGVDMGATVPIPFAAGQSFLAISLRAGDIKHNTIVQPTCTNGQISVGEVQIVQNTYGRGAVSGSSGASGSTNGAAGLSAISHDQNAISTGGTVSSTNGAIYLNK